MHIIKIPVYEHIGQPLYICAEHIVSFKYKINKTDIKMIDGNTYSIDGNKTKELAKIIINSTSGSIGVLE